MYSVYFSICCLLFLSIFVCVYFFKERMALPENKVYSILLISTIIGTIIDIVGFVCFKNFGINSIINILITKLNLLYYYLWIFILMIYVIIISYKNKIQNPNKFFKYLRFFSFLFCFITLVLTIFMPIHLKYNQTEIYPYGLCVNLAYILSGFEISIMICCIILNIKNIRKKEYIPLFVFLLVGTIAILIQKANPAVHLLITCESMVTALMYFTIENPDVKMIQQLELARDQADKANRAKTEFLSSMSHEIRTPLNAIVGFSDCILESETLTEAKNNATDIVNASETLLEIVNGILDISKIEAGKIDIINNKYNAPDTYLELAKLITPKMNEKGLDFSYDIAPDLPNTLFGDHANIKKIVTNLLSNAYKYTDRGFVHYEVNCVNSKNVCKLIISVEDSGRGIRKESMEKMFTKFQRLDEDRNTTIEGTGLGLAITKQLTELMGGRIFVHTVYGQGSKFTVVINQKIEKDDVIEHKKYKTTLDLHDVKLLVVDDNLLNLKVATKLFEKFNANHVVTCESGFQCLEKIKNGEAFDIILLDDMMPKMSGVETLAELKKIPGFNIPVVALTANAISGMREKYLADGFNDYLAKPIEKNELIRVVNELLGRNNTEEIDVVSEDSKPVIVSSENVRDEIIVPEDKIPDVIPVEDNIEEILGDKLDLSKEPINLKNKSSDVDNIELLDAEDNIRDDIVIPELVPLVDINLDNIPKTITYDRTYLENNGVDVNHALELLGDMEMYNMTINDFMSEIDDKWNRIINNKNSKDMANYAIDVHSLKSDCKYLGFMDLADISYQHELKSKENDIDFVLEHFKELEDEYHKMYEIAKKYSENNKTE